MTSAKWRHRQHQAPVLQHGPQKPSTQLQSQPCWDSGKPSKATRWTLAQEKVNWKRVGKFGVFFICLCPIPWEMTMTSPHKGSRSIVTHQHPNIQSGSRGKLTRVGAVGGPYSFSFSFLRTLTITFAPHVQGALVSLSSCSSKHQQGPFPAEQLGSCLNYIMCHLTNG